MIRFLSAMFFLFWANVSFASSMTNDELVLKVGQKRSLSENKYVFFRSGNNRLVSVTRDPLSRNLKIEALAVGRTFFVFHELGAASPRRLLVSVRPKPSGKRVRTVKSTGFEHCKRGRVIWFGSECHFILPGWSQ